jgi:hypothetical protein
MSYLEFLQHAIRELYECEARHLETVSITERFQGETVWDGKVEVFQLVNHPTADKLYAWGYTEDGTEQNLKAATVLALPPIDTPRRAVQAYIVNQYREERASNAK